MHGKDGLDLQVQEEHNDNFHGPDRSAGIRVTLVKFVDPSEFYVSMDDMDEKYVELSRSMNSHYGETSNRKVQPNRILQHLSKKSESKAFENATKSSSDEESAVASCVESTVQLDKENSVPRNSDPYDLLGLFGKPVKKWVVGDPCAVKVEGVWYRAVVAEEPFGTVKVKLSDDVRVVTVLVKYLRCLQLQFRRLPDRVTRCCLGGIRSTDRSWSKRSIYKSERLLHDSNLYMIKMDNHGDLDLSVLPVELLCSKKETSGASATDIVSLNDLLCRKGLAEVVPTLKTPHKDIQIQNAMEDENYFVCRKVQATLNQSNLSDYIKTKFSKTPKAQWFPVEPLEDEVISGKVTFVDKNCGIYIQNYTDRNVDTLQNINREVNEVCARSLPSNIKWKVGDICLARFDLDEKWYRGEILEVKSQEDYLVRFVDYGNQEYLKATDLRVARGLTMWPVQVHVCYFDDLTSVTPEWDSSHLDVIHGLLADKIFRVELRRLKSGLLGIVNMCAPDGTNARDLVVSKGVGRYMKPREDKKDIDGLFWGDIFDPNELGTSFKVLDIPEQVPSFHVELSAIINPDLFLMKVCQTSNAELNLQLQSFVDLQETLQEEADSLPPLDPSGGCRGCISNFEGLWYRAAVLRQPTNLNCTIQYVDYGNIELKPVQELKHMNRVWYSIPAQAIPCRLYGLEFSNKVSREEAIRILQETFDPENDVVASIKRREEGLLEVELRSESGALLYKDLIKSGFYVPRRFQHCCDND